MRGRESCSSTAQEQLLSYRASWSQHPHRDIPKLMGHSVLGPTPASVSDGAEAHCQHHLASYLFVVSVCQQTAFSGKGDSVIWGAYILALPSQYHSGSTESEYKLRHVFVQV